MELQMCDEMGRQGVAHEHRSLHFRVRLPSGDVAEFEPDIVVRCGTILFVLVHLESEKESPRLEEILNHFLEQHSPEIVLVLIAPAEAVRELPPETYDEIYPATDLERVVRRIRDQDPEGLVLPFVKPRG
jgi:hypothetical protein